MPIPFVHTYYYYRHDDPPRHLGRLTLGKSLVVNSTRIQIPGQLPVIYIHIYTLNHHLI